ncbi:MAG TPA: Spy/CpxP family protein refolding chaperone [Longimicrobiales bacterium]|nr:Spy/CpxP family protein refolding chaperone [Longimicrobiales bacterium]
MTWTTKTVAILAAMLAVAPLPMQAQRRGGMDGPRMAGPRGQGIEGIMGMRERLELTDQQVEQLDALRQEAVQRRTAHRAQMEELRSQVRAGQLDRDAVREQMEARREASEAMRTQQQERIDAILNDAQRQQLEQVRAEARAFRMGRQSALRGGRPGMRSGRGMGMRGFERGMRGRGWGDGYGRGGMGRGPQAPPPPDTGTVR